MDLLNNREIASLFWVAVILIVCLYNNVIRKSLKAVVRCMFQRNLLIATLLFYVYIALSLFGLSGFGLWDASQIKITALWSVFVGIVAMYRVVGTEDHPVFFREWLWDNLKIIAFLEFIITFKSFPLPVELVMQPALAFIVMVSAYSEGKEEHKAASTFLDAVLICFGLLALFYAIKEIIDTPKEFWSLSTLKDFYTPILLSFALTPFLYVFFTYSVYETVFIGLGYIFKDAGLEKYARKKAVLSFGFDVEFLKRWRRYINLHQPESKVEIEGSIEKILKLREIEKNPRPVSLAEGWSPHEAQKFLMSYEIKLNDYHEQYGEWCAYSSPFKISKNAVWEDMITYHVEGNQNAVTELELLLDVKSADNVIESEEMFLEIASVLFEKALLRPSCKEFHEMVKSGEGVLQVGEHWHVSVSTRKWDSEVHDSYDKKIIFKVI